MNRIGPRWCWIWVWVWMIPLGLVRAQNSILLEDVTALSGVRFEHFSGRSGKFYIVETVTSGLATFDYDLDGWIDIYLLNGAALPGAQLTVPPANRLFRNVGGMKFVDVTAQSGAGDLGFALGVAIADYDNDGDPDLFVSNFGPNVLLENCGDGTFERREFPVTTAKPRVGAGVSLLDIDADGNLDLYFANYIDFSFDKGVSRKIYGVPAAPGPKDYDPDTDTLYRNAGNGSFVDISVESGIAQVAGPGMGVVAFDFDADRDTDIFVCNDSAANFLFENKGDSTFEEVGVLAGVAYDLTGAQQATMGADVADFDCDGDLDLVTTNFIDEIPTLYRNSGKGYFDDIGAAAGLGVATRSLTWGVGFGDFDCDTWPDLFIASGHLIDGISRVNDSVKFAQPNHVLRNVSGKRFSDITSAVGTAGKAVQVSRGVAIDDLDNDGDCEIVVLNLNDQPQLIHNRSPKANNYLQLQLVGTKANRDAVGSVVRVKVGDKTLMQEVLAGRGYQSHFGSRLTFGLGDATRITSISIQWHGETEQVFGPTQPNQRLLIREGQKSAVVLE